MSDKCTWTTSERSKWVWKKVYGTRFFKLMHPEYKGVLQYGVVDDFGDLILVGI